MFFYLQYVIQRLAQLMFIKMFVEVVSEKLMFFKICIADSIADVRIFAPITHSSHSLAPFPVAVTTLLSVSMRYTYIFFG